LDKTNEPISALADGELDAREAGFLIRRLSADPRLLDEWQRLHALRACLQREYAGPVALVSAVREQLNAEPAPTAPMGRWLKTGLGGALAAGVALVAVIGLGNRLDTAPRAEQADEPAFVSQPTALDRQFSRTVEPAGLGGARADSGNAPIHDRQRINRLMIRHSQMAGATGFRTLTPVLTEPARVSLAMPDRPAGEASESGQPEPGRE